MKHFLPISDRAPDHIRVVTENGAGLDTDVAYEPHDGVADVFVTARTDAVKYVLLRWNAALGEPLRILGDDWERAYGTLEWRGIVKQRSMPWYFLAAYADGVCAYGVRVRPAALCSFTADSDGITLRLDLRNGTQGVRLAGRTVKAATVVCASYEGISEFEAGLPLLARVMCGDPILPERPVYGGNNWYYAYGKSSRSEILGDWPLHRLALRGERKPAAYDHRRRLAAQYLLGALGLRERRLRRYGHARGGNGRNRRDSRHLGAAAARFLRHDPRAAAPQGKSGAAGPVAPGRAGAHRRRRRADSRLGV